MKLTLTTSENSFRYTWLLGRIFPYIKPVLGRAILGILIAIPAGMLDGVVALSLKPYMDYVIGKHDMVLHLFHHTFLISYSLLATSIPFAIIIFAGIQGVLRYLNGYITDWTSQKVTNKVKIDLFSRLIYMDKAFYDENSSGMIMERYFCDANGASAGIISNIKSLLTSSIGALSLIVVMLYSSWKLALIGVVVLCTAFLPVSLMRKRVKDTSNKCMIIGGNITTNINETYVGNSVMRAYCLEERQKNIYETQIWKAFNLGMSLNKRSGWMGPLMYLIASCGIAIVLGYGTQLIMNGEMTAGSFASFVTSLLLLYKPVKDLGGTMSGMQGVFVAMGRMFELFDLAPAFSDKPNAVELKGLKNDVTFNNINFEYVEGRPVIKDLNLVVKKGETLAIVGNSGGGKSTLVNLIPRFYDITDGSIKIDGVDIRDLTMKSLRQNIAMVFQDNFLFSGTIRENILMGNNNATEEEVMQAVESAHLYEMIADLPQGLDTEIGERGTTLSGGQRQRVAIARAMIRKTPIVILDEATSALDNKSEAVVQQALDNLIQNKTVFVVAHRLSTIKHADRIAVINEGSLVELGTHDELMNIKEGHYKALYEMQFRSQEIQAEV